MGTKEGRNCVTSMRAIKDYEKARVRVRTPKRKKKTKVKA